MQPTLIIGLGGTGAHVVAGTLAKLLENPSTAEQINHAIQFLCIDIDTRVAESAELPEWCIQNIGGFALDFVEQACQDDENLKSWFDCQRWRQITCPPALFDPVRLLTAMYRQFGRLCLYHNLARVRERIHHTLSSIQQHNPDTPLVIICTSLVGGTGSAIALDVAYLVRHILATTRMNAHDGYIMGVFALSNIFASAFPNALEEQRIKFILNQVAAINEIRHFAQARYEFGPQGHIVTFDNLEPFNQYWLFGGDRSQKLEGKWPTDFFPLIATEVSNTVVTGDWTTRPKGLEFVSIQAPLTTNVIGDWSYWEDVHNRHLKDPNRLCPYISREFCK